MSTTACGCVTNGVWSNLSVRVRACIRSAMKPLGGRVDHAVFFRDEKPARQVFPAGSRHGLLDARSGNRSLDRGEQGLFFGGGVLGECRGKGVLRQPNLTSMPTCCSSVITRAQLDPSAHAPWTRTTVGGELGDTTQNTRHPAIRRSTG
jgi:hypothetical protein